MAASGPFGQRRSVMAVAGDIELPHGGFWCQCGRARWPLAGAARSAVPMVSLIAHAWADGPAVGSAVAPAGGLTAAEGMRRGQQLLALLEGGAESAADAVAATTVADDLVQPQVVGAAVAGASGRCGAWHDVRSRRKRPPAAGGARGPGPDNRGRGGLLGCPEGREQSPGTAVQHGYAGAEAGP